MARSTGDRSRKIYNELKSKTSSYSSYDSGSSEGRPPEIFIGLLLLGGGLFMIFNNLAVSVHGAAEAISFTSVHSTCLTA